MFVSDSPQTSALYRADMNSVDGEGCLLPGAASIPIWPASSTTSPLLKAITARQMPVTVGCV